MNDRSERPRFMADHMLGSLARWLRLMGYDCKFEKKLEDSEMIVLAKEEGRIILTRDRELAERGDGLLFDSTDLDEQLSVVGRRYALKFDYDNIRCSICNGQLTDISPEEAIEFVPKKSLEHSTKYWRCESCGKIYWNGTHWDGIMNRFNRLGLTEGGN